jgi:hypothetical protein
MKKFYIYRPKKLVSLKQIRFYEKKDNFDFGFWLDKSMALNQKSEITNKKSIKNPVHTKQKSFFF